MKEDGFVDANLMKISDKISPSKPADTPAGKEEGLGFAGDVTEPAPRRSGRRKDTLEIKDNEWKKALFRSWDEFKVARREAVSQLRGIVESIPGMVASSERRVRDLRVAEEKLREILLAIEAIDDSTWNRSSLQAELAKAARKVESAKIEAMLFNSKLGESKGGGGIAAASQARDTSFLHELTSLTFTQAAKLGWGFLFPLILGVLIGALTIALFYYLALH